MQCIGFALIGAILWCDPPAEKPPVNTWCLSDKPILMSHADTRKTKEAIGEHNAAWRGACEGERK